MEAGRDPREVQISNETRSALTSFAAEMARAPDEKPAYRGSFRVGAVPDHLRTDEIEQLYLDGRDYWLFRDVLHRLAEERTLEHLTDRDIDPELWNFTCELYLLRRDYRDDNARRRLLSEFLRTLERPWVDFEAIFSLSDLVVADPFDLGGVRFRTMTIDEARAWGLAGRPSLNRIAEEFDGAVVAVTRVRAGSLNKASERAREKVDGALNLLRVGLAGGIGARVWDEQMLFRRKGVWVVKNSADGDWLTSSEYGFRPFGFELTPQTARHLVNYLEPLDRSLVEMTSGDIRHRVIRAIHKIGTSTTREDYDDKVNDLCTALEAILATRAEKRKAEAIAVRSMLLPAALGSSFVDPVVAYDLYVEKRSPVVHGSEHHICTERDYIWLRQLAIDMLRRYVDLAGRGKIVKHSKLLQEIDGAEDHVRGALELLRDDRRSGAAELRSFAESRLHKVPTAAANGRS